MNVSVKFRLAALGLAVATMGIFIVSVIVSSHNRTKHLWSQLNAVDVESFDIAEHLKESVRELNNTMMRHGVAHDSSAWNEFKVASRRLGDWLNEEASKFTTAHEKAILLQLRAAYNDYLKSAEELHISMQSRSQQSATLADYSQFRAKGQRLFDIGQALARAKYQSRDQFLVNANETLQQLRFSLLSSLALLFVLGLALAVGIYRHMIAPLQVKLVESQHLVARQEKLASLGMLAAGVAHEIRNPLTAIKAALFVHQKNFLPSSPENADAMIVEREISRLERTVNDFLRFARPSEPELAKTPAEVPFKEARHLLKPELEAENIKLVIEDSSLTWINVDVGQIRQVLINLIKNAAESIGRDGTITLRVRREAKSASAAGPVVILEVSDTGKGITPDVEKRLFDPFFTTKDSGTGLGLSMASRIVEKHGGALQYQTWPDHGSVFGIVLPEVEG